MKKKVAIGTVLLAALLSLLLVGTALAVGNTFGLLDFFGAEYSITPDEDASESIEKDLGSSQNDQIRLTVREAVYDGNAVRVVMAIEPLDETKYMVTDDLYYVISEEVDLDDLKTEEEYDEAYAAAARAYQEKTGLTALQVEARLDWPDSMYAESEEPVEAYTSSGCTARDGNAVLTYCEMRFNGDALDTVSLVATADVLNGNTCSVAFALDKTSATVQEMHVADAQDGGVSILSANWCQTPFAEYVRVTYSVYEATYADIAAAFDPNETYYMTEHGRFAHLDSECSGMKNAVAVRVDEVMAKGKLPCPVCAKGNASLMQGAAAWTVELTDADGQPIDVAGVSGSDAIVADAANAYSTLFVLRPASFPAGEVYVRFTSPDGRRLEPIRLK